MFFIPVPPNYLIIYDNRDSSTAKLVEPYDEGSTVNLSCVAHGGKYQPFNIILITRNIKYSIAYIKALV